MPWANTQNGSSFRAIRLSGILERAKGIEPSYKACEAFVLPLNYAREQGDIMHEKGRPGKVRFLDRLGPKRKKTDDAAELKGYNQTIA